MFRKPAQLSCALLILAGIAPAQKGHKEADEPLPFQFQTCPCKAEIGDHAVLDLPKGYVFIDRENVGKFLEFNHNIPDRDELGAVLPANGKWFALYSFQDVGYVRDDEKTKLDPDALLKTMTEATEAGNEERVRRGWGRMRVVGWDQKPYYEERSHNLEWGIIVGNDEGGRSVNHRSRVLGRRGVMSVNLVGSPEDMASNLTAFRTMSNGFSYKPQNRYSAFVKGDKVAEYGLTALILGGAAAAAVKTGFLKSALKLMAAFWKLIIIGFIAIGSTIMKLLRRIFRRGEMPVAEES